jgi:molybdopterin synthase sulfur carrier subunit
VPIVRFTSHLARHVPAATLEVPGTTVREVLDTIFASSPRLRGYLLDEQGRLRKHVGIWVDAVPIVDRIAQSDPVAPTSRLHILQLLSGG